MVSLRVLRQQRRGILGDIQRGQFGGASRELEREPARIAETVQNLAVRYTPPPPRGSRADPETRRSSARS